MKILCIGDSNTYGYDPRSYLGDRYPAEVRWTDRLGDCETINCGVNGMTVPRESSRFRSLSAEQIAGRMERFIGPIIDMGKPVLLIAPPVLQYGEWVLDDDLVDESENLGGAYRELAERKGCLFADSGEWNIEMTFDGVHFSPEGHAVFAQHLERVLKVLAGSEN